MPCRLLSICLVFTAQLAFSTPPAAAQPKPLESEKTTVSLHAEFIVADTSDIDATGINFGLVPLSSPTRSNSSTPQKPIFLEYTTGSDAKQLYHLLTHASPNIKTIKVFSVPTVSTYNQVPVTIPIEATIPDSCQPIVTVSSLNLPQIKHVLQVRGSLTLTPRINTDHSITLGFGLPPVLLRTLASDDTLVISGIRSPMGQGNPPGGVPSIIGMGGHMLPDTGQTLLIFITPTISGKS